jgi:hypothetical protein
MANQNKPRLSDITKKNTTDRASKLAQAFLPAPPALSPPAAVTPTPVEDRVEKVDQREDSIQDVSQNAPLAEEQSAQPEQTATEAKPDPVPAKPAAQANPREKPRRSSQQIDLADIINQPAPDGLRCTRMIMLSDEHHDLLRELSFKFKKPMTVVLYNLLEPAHQALQREKKKGE